MAMKLTYPHVEQGLGESARLVRLPRVRVAQIVMDYLAHGWSADEMCRQHPYLTQAEVHAAMAYYFDHQEELDEEIRCELDEVDRDDANRAGEIAARSPFYTRLRAKGLL